MNTYELLEQLHIKQQSLVKLIYNKQNNNRMILVCFIKSFGMIVWEHTTGKTVITFIF